MPSIPCNFSPSFTKINRLCAYPMQSRFYCPSFAYCRFSLRGCRKGPSPLPLSSAGGGVYPVRSDFLFVRTQRLAVLFSSIRSENPCRRKIVSDLPPPFLSLRGCRKGPPPLPLSSAGGGVYPARRQFVSRLRSMPSALPIYRRRSSSSGDAGRGRRPFRFLPQAGACTPPRSDFLFVRTQRLAVLFSSIRSENLCRRKIASDT